MNCSVREKIFQNETKIADSPDSGGESTDRALLNEHSYDRNSAF